MEEEDSSLSLECQCCATVTQGFSGREYSQDNVDDRVTFCFLSTYGAF